MLGSLSRWVFPRLYGAITTPIWGLLDFAFSQREEGSAIWLSRYKKIEQQAPLLNHDIVELGSKLSLIFNKKPVEIVLDPYITMLDRDRGNNRMQLKVDEWVLTESGNYSKTYSGGNHLTSAAGKTLIQTETGVYSIGCGLPQPKQKNLDPLDRVFCFLVTGIRIWTVKVHMEQGFSRSGMTRKPKGQRD